MAASTPDVEIPPAGQRWAKGSINIPPATLPSTARDTSVDASALAKKAIADLNQGIGSKDAESIGRLFLEGGYWRDHLALTSELRTLTGRAAITSVLEKKLPNLVAFEIDETSKFTAPRVDKLDNDWNVKGIQFFVKVRTTIGSGRGVVRLAQQADGEWKIWTVFTSLQELKGHEEAVASRRPQGVLHGDRTESKNWLEERQEESQFKTADPVVLIVGAGQAGLTIAARLKMLRVPALVIDTNNSIGDSWRRRYRELVLHDPVWYDHLPYLPFPSHWPVFTPKDKLAEFFESYAKLLELDVWTSTALTSAAWDDGSQSWTVTVGPATAGGGLRSSSTAGPPSRTFRPKHIVQATGHSGKPHMPTIPGEDSFRGDLLCHSSAFPGVETTTSSATPLTAVVVGSCNSAHDIAHAYQAAGHTVTIVQRSSTCVVSSDSITRIALGGLYSEDSAATTDDADVWFWSVPSAVLKAQHVQLTRQQAANDAATHAGLRAAGFGLDAGPDTAGLFPKYLQRGGGYYIDVGTSRLIADGRIRVRHGVEVAEVLERGLRLTDGSTLDADHVVFATGFDNMVTAVDELLGSDVAGRVGDVWGWDAEGEMRNLWRRTGQQGLWLHAGNLAFCRYYSRILALQIKASLEGIF